MIKTLLPQLNYSYEIIALVLDILSHYNWKNYLVYSNNSITFSFTNTDLVYNDKTQKEFLESSVTKALQELGLNPKVQINFKLIRMVSTILKL